MKKGYHADNLLKQLSTAIWLLMLGSDMTRCGCAAPTREVMWCKPVNPSRGSFPLILTRGRASPRTASECMTPEQYDKEFAELVAEKWVERHIEDNVKPADSADITQEVWKRMAEAKATRLESLKTLRGYVRTTVRNVQIDRAKRWDAKLEFVGDQETLDEGYATSHGVDSGPVAELLRQERKEHIRDALLKMVEELPEWLRRVVILLRLEELSYAECAERLGMTESSVRTAAKNAMSELRAKSSAALKEWLSEEREDGV
jgi:RNA polymerase sigma factor (sigma-70 family)